MNSTHSAAAKTTKKKEPAQKSMSSTTPRAMKKIGNWQRMNVAAATIFTALFRDTESSSPRNATVGSMSEMLEVSPARKRRRNQRNEKRVPHPIRAKIRGIVTKLMLKLPLCAASRAPALPKKAKASGMTMEPPRITSANSLSEEAVSPERTMSSPLER